MAELERGDALAAGTLARTGRELWSSWSGRLAAIVLALLGAGALFAPLLANDRPLVLVSDGRAAYARALQVLTFAAAGLAGHVEEAERTPGAVAGSLEAIQRDAAAVERAARAMSAALADADRAALDSLGREAAGLLALGPGEPGTGERVTSERVTSERAAALAAARALGQRAAELAAAHALWDEGDPSRPEPGGVALVPRRSFPALAALGAFETWLAALVLIASIAALAARALRSLERRAARPLVRSAARVPRAAVLTAAAALALVPALALRASGGGGRAAGATSSKAELAAEPDARALFAPVPYGYAESQLAEIYRPPTWASGPTDTGGAGVARVPRERGEPAPDAAGRHWLGTDSLGRDLLARILWGGRASLAIGIAAALLAALLGTALGALAGYFGGALDFAVSRAIEVVQCFPAFVLVLLVVGFTDPEVVARPAAIVAVIALVRWTGVARLVRSELLRVRELDYVAAARAQGFSPLRVLLGHALPNAAGPAIVAASFDVSAAIVTESALSFLGFGVEHPFPSWGALLNESRNPEHWWIQVFPGLLIFATVVACNRVGEAAREALEPRARIAP